MPPKRGGSSNRGGGNAPDGRGNAARGRGNAPGKRGSASGGRGSAAGGQGRDNTRSSNPPPARAAPSPVRATPPPPAPVSMAQLSSDLEMKASISQPNVMTTRMLYPPRPGFGKAGQPITVYANHFKVDLRSNGDVYHYDVAFTEEGGRKIGNDEGVPPKSMAEKLMNALERSLETKYPGCNAVSDWRKNLYSPHPLPFTEERFEGLDIGDRVGRDQTPKLFQAVVKEASPVAINMEQLALMMSGRLNYTPHDALHALDVALRHTASQRLTMVNRNLYSNVDARSIGEGAMAWSGYFQSLRPTQNRLIINLDLSTTAFVRAMPVLEYVAEVVAFRDSRSIPTSLDHRQHSAVSKSLRGVKVETSHRPVKRTYRVNGLSPRSAAQTMFEDENGRRISVAQYFAQHYQALRYPNLPCLHVGALNKKMYMPMEVCRTVSGQKCPRKTTEKQTAEMIKVACVRPQDRKTRIEQRVREAQFDSDVTLKAFGLHVDPKMVTTNARVLPTPSLMYGGNSRVQPAGGVWNMAGKKFYQPELLHSFGVVCMDDRADDRSVRDFFNMVCQEMKLLGMSTISKLPPIIRPRQRNERFSSTLFTKAMDAAQSTYGVKAQIIWMINPRSDAAAYGELKRVSDTQFGIVSQCMLSKHISRPSKQYVANILLKVHTKIGGVNTVVHGGMPQIVDSKPTIIFGADVTHPSPGDGTRPSIAALIGSLDRSFVKHSSVIRAQGHRVEQIVNLKDMVVDLLKAFYRHSKVKPQQIVFYRDGVSEGQFQMVLNHEVAAIRQACAMLEPGYQPSITFIVVQKRHHTRFFVTKPADADRSGNVKAGTVVDSGVCHPTEYDFYLMSHAGIQGTSRPTHYHVLLDEMRFAPDDLQSLTYKLCHTYARCTRSVSMVASAYYSHLLAYRARFFTSEPYESSDDNVSVQSSATVNTDMCAVHDALKPVQFYI